MPGLSSRPLLEEALSAVRGHEAIEECQVICRLSRVYFANSQFELANETARDAMAMARHLKDKEGLFDALVTLLHDQPRRTGRGRGTAAEARGVG